MSKKKKRLRGASSESLVQSFPTVPDKAQIGIEDGEPLYREIRIENVLTDEHGETARLKPGANVDVVVEADSDATFKP